MPEEANPRWMQLAAQAPKERDPVRLLLPVQEINRLLQEGERKPKLSGLSKAS